MTDYTDVFNNAGVPAAESSYQTYSLTANATFNWPYNYSGTGYIVAKTLEISCSSGVVMTMPAANQVSDGETTLIRNTGAETLTVQKSDASALATIAAGAAVMLYVTDNSTVAGVWGVVTYGTGSSTADATTLAGLGLAVSGSTLTAAYTSEIKSSSFSIDANGRAKFYVYTGGAGTVSLPLVSSAGVSFFFLIRNSGTGTLTIDPNGSETIDGLTTVGLNPGESTIIACSGTAWFTVGQGRSMLYQFTQLVKDVSAAGSFTLTPVEASNKLLTFTGSPASAVTIVVPDVVSIYYIYNDLTTVQSVTVKTAAGASYVVPQGQRAIVFCDSVDILSAQTASVTGAIGTADINNNAVTYAKIQDVSATDKILGRATAGSGDIEEITCTPFARSILDDTNEATFKATVNLEIGVDVQAYDADTAKLDVIQAWTAAQTFTGAILNDGYTEEVFAVTGTTPALSPTNGSIQTWTLTANSVPTQGTWAAGQSITLMISDGTAYTITWPSITWVGGSAPTLATTGHTVVELWKVSTTVYGALVGAVA